MALGSPPPTLIQTHSVLICLTLWGLHISSANKSVPAPDEMFGNDQSL